MRGLDKWGLDKGFYGSLQVYNFCYMIGLDIKLIVSDFQFTLENYAFQFQFLCQKIEIFIQYRKG